MILMRASVLLHDQSSSRSTYSATTGRNIRS
jgi:hypothetical protein